MAPPAVPRGRALRLVLLVAITFTAVIAVFAAFDRFPQPARYHGFADQRSWRGLPHAANVLSNLPFAVVGALGLRWLLRGPLWRPAFADARERRAWLVFFAAVLVVGFGSAWFHLEPGNARLVADRLPLAVACVAVLDAVIAERISARVGRALLVPLVAIALGSVAWWAVTESRGRGDLRLYGLVQYFSPLGIALMLLLFPARTTRGGDYWLLLLWFAAAKLGEHFDHDVFRLTAGTVSGHTLKHLCAAAGACQLLHMLRRRRCLSP